MKTVRNNNPYRLAALLCALLCVLTGHAQPLPFRLPGGAGSFRLGVIRGNESRWLDQCKITKQGQTCLVKDKLWKDGNITLTVCPLTASEGFILEVSGEKLPEDLRFCWAFGACAPAETTPLADSSLPAADNVIPAAACRDNVFSTEGNAFTVYYGEVMKLRTVRGVTPVGSDIRLSDARRQETPLALFRSGKKTDSPVISALCPWTGEKLYFCLYKQNAKADYNYFMLPRLFEKEYKALSK